jgi:hypothetical protein
MLAAVALVALGLLIWGVIYWFTNVTVGGVILGAFAGAFAGTAGGAVVGLVWGKHRDKASLGPLPPFAYAAAPKKLRRDFLQ